MRYNDYLVIFSYNGQANQLATVKGFNAQDAVYEINRQHKGDIYVNSVFLLRRESEWNQ